MRARDLPMKINWLVNHMHEGYNWLILATNVISHASNCGEWRLSKP